MSNNQPPLVNIVECLMALGHTKYEGRSEHSQPLIKKYGIEVMAEIQWGKGTAKLMRKDQMAELIRIHGKPKAPDADCEEETRTERLERKINSMETSLKASEVALNLVLKSNNILADRLASVLKQLGVETTPNAV